MDVLKLLTKGLSNSEIASNLFISPKTVDHHISAILSKLKLHSRTEAATFAQSSGMVEK
jgi:DNA-binding NarL/FixJ family response regulator